MKNIFKCLSAILISICLFGCGDPIYDKGYQDGLTNRKDPAKYRMNQKYRQGFDKASQEYFFNIGSRDAKDGQPPLNLENADYMLGYDSVE